MPLADGHLLGRLGGGFVLLGIDADVPEHLVEAGIEVRGLALGAGDDGTGALAACYLGTAGSAVYLIRPDQHVAGRWDTFDDAEVRRAVRTATGQDDTASPGPPVASSASRPLSSPPGPAPAGSTAPPEPSGSPPGRSTESSRTSGGGASLVLAPNIPDPDGFHDELLQAHDGLERHESAALDARLILVLCNHIGDRDVLREALSVARLGAGERARTAAAALSAAATGPRRPDG